MRIQNIEDVRAFVETARRGSLTAAAAAMDISPAAASAMLKRLELQLDARLFERSTRTLRITARGQALLDHASRALALLEEGEAQIASENGSPAGTVRVAAPSDLTRSVLLPWIDAFLQARPGIRVSLAVTDRVQDVLRDEVDIALRYGALADSGLVARQLHTTRRVLCAAPAYLLRHGTPTTPGDLLRHNCLTFHLAGRRYAAWRFERAGDWTEVRVDGDRDADDAAIAHQWALAGAGLLYKSELDVVHDLASGALVRLLPDWQGEHYALHAVLPSNRFVPARVRALVDFLAERFAHLCARQNPGSPEASGLKR